MAAAGDIVLGTAPALFGLMGTLVGASLTYHSSGVERRGKADHEARDNLLKVSAAIHRLGWMTKVGAVTPEDVSVGSHSISAQLRSSSQDALASLLDADIPYRVSFTALKPAEMLAFRWDQRKVRTDDPNDAQELVAFLLGILDHPRRYRRSDRIWARLKSMSELDRGRRWLEGVPEGESPFGFLDDGRNPA